ncbi:hypothetical protein [Mesorhizobium sp. CAU 1741]|uniref:SH3 domain-containing protein n=1 Tax=Mesorhizobium sp. CAU 1741 TaxID=3140366 RepID=UPI00325A8E08
MLRLFVPVYIACCLLASGASFAQEAEGSAGPTSNQSLVRGLAATDLLNVREDPSPLGKTLGRLPNGAFVERQECKLVKGYEWCLVEAPEFENLSGWTPSRYLYSLDVGDADIVAEGETSQQPSESDSEMALGPTAEPSEVAAEDGVPVPRAAPRIPAEGSAEDASDVPEKEARVLPSGSGTALPDGLEARFAGGSSRPIAEIMAQDDSDPAQPPSNDAEANARPVAAGVPVPTPRPDASQGAEVAIADEPSDDQAPVLAMSGEPLQNLPTGAVPGETVSQEIPCARYIGQPMARCMARVVRTGEGAADVTVVWPDGGSRVIEFRDGRPSESNSSGELRFTREGSLNMIRIGVSERFEILDALPFDG